MTGRPAGGDMALRGEINPVSILLANDWDVLSKCGWTAWDGCEVQRVPVLTMVRGRVVAREGRVSDEPGWGRHARPVPDPAAVSA